MKRPTSLVGTTSEERGGVSTKPVVKINMFCSCISIVALWILCPRASVN